MVGNRKGFRAFRNSKSIPRNLNQSRDFFNSPTRSKVSKSSEGVSKKDLVAHKDFQCTKLILKAHLRIMVYSLFLKKQNYQNVGDEAHISTYDLVSIYHPTAGKRKADRLLDSLNIGEENSLLSKNSRNKI
jgi:hypothetical protein